jgi:glycerol-3-phosphate dehydrogenase (NAD(P)+)
MLVGVIGAGGWGTALAKVLCEKGNNVTLWCHSEETYQNIRSTAENTAYLPNIQLPATLEVTRSLAAVSAHRDLILCTTPSHFLREVMTAAAPFVDPETVVACGSKGIEGASLMTMGDVLVDVLGSAKAQQLAFLSGPTFAMEVALGLPAALTVASSRESVATRVQESLSTPDMRVYTSTDIIGVQMGGVIKNIIAIAAGISDGLGLGNNARAALITRGLAEMARLATTMGANPSTLSGLPGLGDLVLTCTGDLSRNRRVGLEIGRGRRLSEIVANTKTIAEGVRNTRSVHSLAARLRVEMPIVEQMYRVLYEGKEATQGVKDLMGRTLKPEAG